MAAIFDGVRFAEEKERTLSLRILGLKSRGIYPKLATILIGEDAPSLKYVELKKKAAERVNADLDIYKFGEKAKLEDVLTLIKILNEDDSFHGIMVQLPLPKILEKDKEKILNSISPDKDVDGLRGGSKFLHPTSKAAFEILKFAEIGTKKKVKSVCVVGATGMVGSPLVKKLKEEGYKVIEVDKNTPDLESKTKIADSIISATGKLNLINDEKMVKDDAIIIDIGAPFGDVQLDAVSKKASFITPVPGGVGPVTISCLLENLVAAC